LCRSRAGEKQGKYEELKEHRAAVSKALLGHDMRPLDMANDAALSLDLIDASLAKVDRADAYIGLTSYRCGQIPECSLRNSNKLYQPPEVLTPGGAVNRHGGRRPAIHVCAAPTKERRG
jgi:hypothetical protein